MISHRMTWIYFVIGGLCLLKAFDDPDTAKKLSFTAAQIIDWIYLQQIGQAEATIENDELWKSENYIPFDECKHFGFRGGNFMKFTLLINSSGEKFININDIPHLANTYSALWTLLMLGDDLSRVQKLKILDSLGYYQKEDGRIQWLIENSEDDVRFAYWAAAIYHILSSKLVDEHVSPSFNVEDLIKYWKSWLSFDGGFSWSPFSESHSGLTYWTLGIFKLLNKMDELEDYKEKIIEFLVSRQQSDIDGFQGRINKIPDSWYSFWNAGSLAIINPKMTKEFIDHTSIKIFLKEWVRYGGYAKMSFSEFPDIFHTFYSLAFLAIIESDGLNKIDPVLAIPQTNIVNT